MDGGMLLPIFSLPSPSGEFFTGRGLYKFFAGGGNMACASKFTADRSIMTYADKIWNVKEQVIQ